MVFEGLGLVRMENVGVLDDIVLALATACEDYACDSRGDIGSWVRETACESIAVFFFFVHKFKTIPATYSFFYDELFIK